MAHNVFHSAWRQTMFGNCNVPYQERGEIVTKKTITGGRALDSFRSGSRSEYLACYGLSRFSFVNQVPRQEDFGVADYFCTLGKLKKVPKKSGKGTTDLVYPEVSFYVQVKSNRNKYELNKHSIEWISNHMANPFYICIVEQQTSTLCFYSCTLIWKALTLRPESSGISFFFSKEEFLKRSKGKTGCDKYIYQIGDDKEAKFNIFLGEPIFIQTLNKLESDDSEEAYHKLKPHIMLDLENIRSARLGRAVSSHIVDGSKRIERYHGPMMNNRLEESLIEQLKALAANYIQYGFNDRFNKLMDYLESLGVTLKDMCEVMKIAYKDPGLELASTDALSDAHADSAAPLADSL